MKFQERLKQLREEQDLSKRELAVKLGIPPSTYYDYENGKTQPDLSKIIKIAEFFDVNSDYLLGLSDSRKRIVLKREEFEHLIPPEYKEQTRDLECHSDVDIANSYVLGLFVSYLCVTWQWLQQFIGKLFILKVLH